MSDVPEWLWNKAVAAASKAASRQRMDVHYGELASCVGAALAAVAPHIAAAERERCAVVAENHEWFVGGIGTTAPGSGQAKAIATAIRALSQ